MTLTSYSILLCIILPTIIAKLLFNNKDRFPNDDDLDYMSDHYSDDDCSLDADDEYVPNNYSDDDSFLDADDENMPPLMPRIVDYSDDESSVEEDLNFSPGLITSSPTFYHKPTSSN